MAKNQRQRQGGREHMAMPATRVENPQEESRALLVLDKYRGKEDQYHILLPTVLAVELHPDVRFQMAELTVSPDPNHGDVYVETNAAGGLALTKNCLHRLASAAGIMWHPTLTGPEIDTPEYVQCRAVCAIMGPNGQWQWLPPATKSIRRSDELAEVRASAEEKVAKRELKAEYVEAHVARAMRNLDKHRLRKCESKAMNAAIRMALSLRSTYKASELKKPFLVPRFLLLPDYSDPAVRQQAIQESRNVTTLLFGGPRPERRVQTTVPEAQAVSEEKPADQAPAPPPSPAPAPDGAAGKPTAEQGAPDLPCEGEECPNGSVIRDHTSSQGRKYTAQQIATLSRQRHGKPLCWECSTKANKAGGQR